MQIPDELEKWMDKNADALMFQDADLETMPEGWQAEMVQHYGGEGMGDQYYTVYRFNNIYVKFNGFYSSYEGAEYVDKDVVTPIDRMVTFYE